MTKLKIRSLADLVRLAERARIMSEPPRMEATISYEPRALWQSNHACIYLKPPWFLRKALK
ncbi:hypothetical protein [Methyloglobulus sp.]|uniref:hypothetical protein n=1 Tax=Methyloglobulus sp. TaxID=2518622 RepID=UPI00398A2E2F